MKYNKEWYDSLNKPPFQPPSWLFAPVWTLLYILMFISFVLVLTASFKWSNLFAYVLFIVQVDVNLSWSQIFFKEHNLRKAFLASALLTLLVFFTMIIFYHISKLAGILFLPYFLWCCFATVLCFEILERNEW